MVDMIVYKAVNKTNGKVYIGQTIYDIEYRQKTHTTGQWRTKFKHALDKYGVDGFEWSVLCECSSLQEMNGMEKKFIEEYDSINTGYNLMSGGKQGGNHTETTKQKISEAMKGEKNPFYGKTHSEEAKKKIGECETGERNHNAREYIITTPTGEEILIKGLREFCREHGLTRELMGACARGKQSHHKGYKCRYNG